MSALAIACLLCAASQPPKEIPKEHNDAFTMGDRVTLERFFVDDTNQGKGTHYKYGRADIDYMINQAGLQLKRLGDRPAMHKTTWILRAIQLHPIKDLDVVVFGSMEPWFEAICVAAGAKTVTTIEYNRLTYDHPKIITRTVAEVEELNRTNPSLLQFDAALSMSSFDHDGLGRYGDPVDPTGDLKAMQKARAMLKPSGFLFLTIPIGPDVLAWNLHRRYGELRLPLMLEGWQVKDRVGWNAAKLTAPANYRQSYEPVFVLGMETEAEKNTKTEL